MRDISGNYRDKKAFLKRVSGELSACCFSLPEDLSGGPDASAGNTGWNVPLGEWPPPGGTVPSGGPRFPGFSGVFRGCLSLPFGLASARGTVPSGVSAFSGVFRVCLSPPFGLVSARGYSGMYPVSSSQRERSLAAATANWSQRLFSTVSACPLTQTKRTLWRL